MTYYEAEQNESWIAESIGFKAGERVLIHGSIPALFVCYTNDGFCRVTCVDPWDGSARDIPTNPEWLTRETFTDADDGLTDKSSLSEHDYRL